MYEFPKDFFWGAATSAYQVEGNNRKSDWWEWEKRVGLKEVSGEACRHYELYRQDFNLAAKLNHNAHRLSIEWSRIEPEEGKFSAQEIKHYLDVVLFLRERNIEPIITLHHFTNPLWFSKLGGWKNRNARGYFLRYTKKVVESLCGEVKYWVTINEPMVYVYHAYILGVWPPQEKSFLVASRVTDNLADAHIKAYEAIHSIYRSRNLSLPMVSIAKNLQAFVPCVPSLKNKVAVYLREKNFNFKFIDTLIRHRALDFIGVNYYSRSLAEAQNWGIKSLLLDICKNKHSQLKKNTLGWDIYPEGLYSLLLKLKRYDLPVFILENGICTEDDNTRWDFICEHLKRVHLAISQGVKVLGYIYWSLLDNFEWDKGFGPHFGLIEVDYATYKRTVRESAQKFSLVCKTGQLG
jgi:beta-glucosidase